VLVMSVNPGFGGQKFISSQLRTIEAIAKRVAKESLDVQIEVDGGIDPETAREAVNAGATALVAGTAVFRGGAASYADNIKALRGGHGPTWVRPPSERSSASSRAVRSCRASSARSRR
jgi:ribulose-phosphate 3-epimerase